MRALLAQGPEDGWAEAACPVPADGFAVEGLIASYCFGAVDVLSNTIF